MSLRLLLVVPLMALAAAVARPPREGLIVVVAEGWDVRLATSEGDPVPAVDGLAWHDGELYLADERGPSIGRWREGSARRTIADRRAGLRSPEDLVIHPDGTVYCTDDEAGGVWAIAPDGEVTRLVGTEAGLTATEGIALAPNGNLVVGDGERNAVFEVTRDGKVTLLLGPEAGLRAPESLAFAPDGTLYIADNQTNTIYRWRRGASLETVFNAKHGVHPESLCFWNGTLFITDDEAGKLYEYTPATGLRTIFVAAGRLKNLQGMAPGPDGALWIGVQDLKRNRGLLLRVLPAP
jgi:streptogramin lyase